MSAAYAPVANHPQLVDVVNAKGQIAAIALPLRLVQRNFPGAVEDEARVKAAWDDILPDGL